MELAFLQRRRGVITDKRSTAARRGRKDDQALSSIDVQWPSFRANFLSF